MSSLRNHAFERKPGGFQAHVTEEHNMWNYIFFMMHLHRKVILSLTTCLTFQDHTTYTANEQFFAECVGIKNVEEEDDEEDVIEIDDDEEEEESKEALTFPIGRSLGLHSVSSLTVCQFDHPMFTI
jgi:hypothetical protein